MKFTQILTVILLLLLTTSVLAMGPPEIEWERLYFSGHAWSFIRSIIETSDGGFAATIGVSADTSYSLYKLSSDGDILWGARSDLDNQGGEHVIELENGDLIVTGWGRETPESNGDLLISRFDSIGQEIWTKLYNSSYDGSEIGYSVAQLPDGGFAICGEIYPDGMNQAWILRTDALGDTLWTREWGWQYGDKAVTVLYIDNGLTVLMQGRTETTSGGPHLVRYDLDGNLLWETVLEYPYSGSSLQAQDMCRASDGGLLFLDNYHPRIAHFDILGNFDWFFSAPGSGSNYGWSISTTMDGGFIYTGENTIPLTNGLKLERSGMISRHDSQGNELWSNFVYGCTVLYSACQLSQGGYIAAGRAFTSTDSYQGYYQGYLIKYAPELGIESGNVSVVEIASVSPNPFSSSLSITCSLPSQVETSLTAYDLNGRIVDVVEVGSFPAGEHTVLWTPSSELSSGCYQIRLHTDIGTDVVNCVLLKK